MVTIDKVVENVAPYKGDLKSGRRDYERAKQGLELIEEESLKLEDALKRETGYSEFNLPYEPATMDIQRGPVTFSVKSEMTTKRPQYKTAVTQMENYLNGLNFLTSEGRVITGIAKSDDDGWMIRTDKLLESYEVIVAGIMFPDLRQKIDYTANEELKNQPVPSEIDLKGRPNASALTENNFVNYVMMDRMKENLETYVSDFEKDLKKQKKEGVIEVSSRSGYEKTKNIKEGTNWGYVVKTLISASEKDPGELNILANPEIGFEEKQRDLPFYQLYGKDVRGERKIFVTLESVYDRIQDLKEQEIITSKTTKLTPKELV